MLPFAKFLCSGSLKQFSHSLLSPKASILAHSAALSSFTFPLQQCLASGTLNTQPSQNVLNPSCLIRWSSSGSSREAARQAALRVQRLDEAHARRSRLQEFQDRKRKSASKASRLPIIGDDISPSQAGDNDASQLTVTPTEGPVGDVQVSRE